MGYLFVLPSKWKYVFFIFLRAINGLQNTSQACTMWFGESYDMPLKCNAVNCPYKTVQLLYVEDCFGKQFFNSESFVRLTV